MKRFLVFILFLLLIPTLYAQWEMINSPLATPEITKLSVAPNGYIYSQTSNKELFRSEDNGLTWSKISTLINAAYNFTYGTDGKMYATSAGGIAISTDLGVTWERKQITLDGSITDIEITNSGYIVACEYYGYGTYFNGVYISTNNGNQWTKVTSGLDGEEIVGMCKDSFGNLYLITWKGAIFKSSNQGYNWNLTIDLIGLADDIEIDSNNILFAASNGIYRSTNFGSTWEMVNNMSLTFYLFIDEQNSIYVCSFDDLQKSTDEGNSWVNYSNINSQIRDVAAKNGTTYIGTSKGLLSTSDFGNTWKLCFKDPERFCKVNDLITTNNGKIIAGTVDGLFISSDNGSSWDSSFVNQNINKISIDALGNIYFTTNQIYISRDEGISWTQYLSDIRNFYINDSNYIFPVSSIRVFKSTNYGTSWDTLFHGAMNISEIHGISQNSSGSVFISTYHRFYMPGYGYIYTFLLMRTDNNGINWEQVRNDLYISNIYFNDSTMYLTTYDDGIFKSTNSGVNVNAINNGLTNLNVSKMLITPSGVLICVTGNGIHSSLDNGYYWVRLDHTGLLSSKVNGVFYNENGVLYSCTDNGIGKFAGALPVELTSFTASISLNKVKLNWQTATELNNKGFEIQRKLENSDWITIGFRTGKGTTSEPTSYFYEDDISKISVTKILYRLKQIDFDGTVSYSEEIEVVTQPFDYALYQNYPNPFNPETIIKYEVPQISNVKIEVFDILGRVVKVLVDEEKTPGRYEIKFDASSLASGIYYYRIKANEFVQTKKMMLIK